MIQTDIEDLLNSQKPSLGACGDFEDHYLLPDGGIKKNSNTKLREIYSSNMDFDKMEQLRLESIASWAEEVHSREKYQAFYEEALKYLGGLSDYSLGRSRTLANHFSKFRPEGSQPLFNERGELNYSPKQIGTIFNNLFRYSKKIVKAN